LERDFRAQDLGDNLLVLDDEARANFLAINFDNSGGVPFFKHVADDG
jgi:hypothetical protein